jgi:cytochrome c6
MKLVVALLLAASSLSAMNPALAADPMRGQQIYMMHCVSCHGPRGLSMSPNTPSFAKGEGQGQPDMVLLQTVKMGKKAQPPFFGILNDQQILDSLAYIRTLR